LPTRGLRETREVACHQEIRDVPSTVPKQFEATHRARDDLVVAVRGIALVEKRCVAFQQDNASEDIEDAQLAFLLMSRVSVGDGHRGGKAAFGLVVPGPEHVGVP
jgi:hypothetical protein